MLTREDINRMTIAENNNFAPSIVRRLVEGAP